MLLDTGASTVVLSANDARAIGIDTTKLRYVIPVDTANGKTLAARITIKSLAVGPIKLRRIEALVAGEGDLRESLLGMSFLNRLRSYEVTGDFLVLRS
jgi:aspartyl protease family protein